MRVQRTRHPGEAGSETQSPKDHAVDSDGVTAEAAEDEDDDAYGDGCPAIEEDFAVGRDFDDLVP